jgi:glutamate racemase
MDFMDNRPIGLFDSGVGGLTVLKELTKLLPNESIVYFGDCGRSPYGIKSKETIIKYTWQDVNFLLRQDVKMIVVACNTASAYGYEIAKDGIDIPMIEVVEPGAETVVRETQNKNVGVIGTTATIKSDVYNKAIKRINESVQVTSKACPLFVNLVEEGWWENDVAQMVAKEYLGSFRNKNIDTLVMGCTHYPLLEKIIKNEMGKKVRIVSSAHEVARVVEIRLKEKKMLRKEKKQPVYKYFTSDSPEKFIELGSLIMNKKLDNVEKIEIERY